MGLTLFVKEIWECSITPSAMGSDSDKTMSVNQGMELQQTPNLPVTSDFQPLVPWEINVLFISHLVYEIFIVATRMN